MAKGLQNLPLQAGSNIYANRVFIERIKQFQADLIFHENHNGDADSMDYEENNIHYKIFIRSIKEATGETVYIFAMTSLQPGGGCHCWNGHPNLYKVRFLGKNLINF